MKIDKWFEHLCSPAGQRESLERSTSHHLWRVYEEMYTGRRSVPYLGLSIEDVAQLALRARDREEDARLAVIAERAARLPATSFDTPRRDIDLVVRRIIQRRARGKCENCRRARPLELHHLHYRTVGFELPHDLVALCRDCHQARHVSGGMFYRDSEEISSDRRAVGKR